MYADDWLDDHGIDYTLVEQDRPTRQCKDSAEERDVSETKIVKSIIVKRDDDYLHCLLPGNQNLDTGQIAEAVEMADEDEVADVTGFEPGTVHPFASDCKLLVDDDLLQRDRLSFTTGDPTRGIVIDTAAFLEALEQRQFEILDITHEQTSPGERLADRHGIQPGEAKDILQADDRELFEAVADDIGAEEAAQYVRFMERAADGSDLDADLTADEIVEAYEQGDSRERREALIVTLLEGGSIEEDDGFDLEAAVEAVIDDNPDAVDDYQDGEDGALDYLVGQVMQQSQGRADPQETRELLLDRL
ncbi:MAG: YbaK/EbsC family protein [Candidatus Nanohaloarchaea archaeon]|nr:YbaK/EbsC family protein [Candidatus Nanohaloarchaea archaeon]